MKNGSWEASASRWLPYAGLSFCMEWKDWMQIAMQGRKIKGLELALLTKNLDDDSLDVERLLNHAESGANLELRDVP